MARASAGIGPQGGALDGPDGSRLTVSAGTLASYVELDLAKNADGAPPLPAEFGLASHVYCISARSGPQALPPAARLTLPLALAGADAASVRVLFAPDGNSQWALLDSQAAVAAAASGAPLEAAVSRTGHAVAVVVTNDAMPALTLTAPARAATSAGLDFNVAASGAPTDGLRLTLLDVTDGARLVAEGAGATLAARAALTPQFNGTRRYVAVGQRGASLAVSNVISLEVALPTSVPAIIAAPRSVSVAVGDRAQMSVQAVGSNLSYQWLRDGQPIAGANQAVYTTPALTPANNAERYDVRVSNAAGAEVSQSGLVTILANPAPVITAQPVDYALEETLNGSNSVSPLFSVTASAVAPSYQWQALRAGRWVDVLGGNGTGYTRATLTRRLDHGSQFRVVVSTSGGSVTSNAATLTVRRNRTLLSRNRVAVGVDHGLAIRVDRRAVAWGINNYGQLGNGSTTTPAIGSSVPAGGFLQLLSVAAGYSFTLFIREGGELYATGANDRGQLGLGDTTGRASPEELAGTGSYIAVAAGAYHALAIDNTNRLYGWGYNFYGQVGNNSTTNVLSPTSVIATDVVAVAAGRDHSLAILRNGQMLSWGRNVVGELGDGSLTQRNAPVTVTGISTAVHCAGGHGHSLAVLQDGSVWAWGSNYLGALGLDLTGGATGTIIPFMIPGLRNAVMVAAGALFSAALLADGTVRVWGANSLGSLGLGDTEERRAPVPVPGLSNIVHISAGLFHLLAVDRDGNVFSSGPGVGGELGRALPDPSLGLDPRFQYAYAAGQLASFSGPL